MAFGPHGPREPILQPGGGAKIGAGIFISIAAAAGLFYTVRLFGKFSPDRPAGLALVDTEPRCALSGNDKPKTMSKEWQEASTARAVRQIGYLSLSIPGFKTDPIPGPPAHTIG